MTGGESLDSPIDICEIARMLPPVQGGRPRQFQNTVCTGRTACRRLFRGVFPGIRITHFRPDSSMRSESKTRVRVSVMRGPATSPRVPSLDGRGVLLHSQLPRTGPDENDA